MKKNFVLIGVILLIGLVIVGIGVFLLPKGDGKDKKEKTKKEIKDIVKLEYSYTSGMAIDDYARYTVECVDINCTYTIKPSGKKKEEEKVIKFDNGLIKLVEEMLTKYDVYSWDGFDKNDSNVLDGNSFSLSIKLKNGDTISARGYMMWPDHYDIVSNELDDFFLSIYEGK